MKNDFELGMFSEFSIPSFGEWKETAEQSLKGKPLEKLYKKTYEKIQLKPIYTQADVENVKHVKDLPGEGTFVRGTKSLGAVKEAWKIAQEISAKSPSEFNEALRYDLERGQTMVNLKVDQATSMGIDSDEASLNTIGKNGVPINTFKDLKTAFDQLELEGSSIFIQAGISSVPVLAQYIALAKEQGIELDKLNAFIGLDPLGQYLQEGTTAISIEKSYDLMASATKWVNEHHACVRTIHVQGDTYHNAGGSAVEELAFSIASAVSYMNGLLDRGLDIDDIARNIYFTLSIGSNYFMEVSKFRAARMLWSKIVEAYGGNEESQKMYIHGRTSSWNKTVYDPYVNMLRTTTEAFAGAVGGVDSMHVSPFDEVVRASDEFSRRIARNTQVILQEESHVNKVVDPAGGSWYVEALTDELAQKAWELFQTIESEGGMLQAIQNDFVQNRIHEVVNEKIANIEHRKDRIVGTNMYPNLEEKRLEVNESKDAETRKSQLSEYKSSMNEEVTELISKVSEQNEQALDYLIQAAEQGATIGQMLHAVKSDDKDPEINSLKATRAAEGFETLRNNAASYKEKNGEFPKVFFANLGSIPKHKARSDFASGFFAAGGFEAVKNNGYESADEAVSAAISSGLSTVIICGPDDVYPEMVPAIAKGIKTQNGDVTIFVAGKQPSEIEQALNEASVDGYIHLKSNCYQVLSKLQEQKGVKA